MRWVKERRESEVMTGERNASERWGGGRGTVGSRPPEVSDPCGDDRKGRPCGERTEP